MGMMDLFNQGDVRDKLYAAAAKSNVPQGGITGKLFSAMFPHGLGNLAFGRNPEPMPPLETPEGTALMADLASNMMVPGTFIGPKGLARLFGDDAAKGMLAAAESKLAQGVPKEAVFQELGVFKGPEGKWRYELDDSGTFYRGAKSSGKPYANAADVLAHNELYDAYPALGNAGVDELSTRGEPFGAYDARWNKITLDGPDKSSTILHELQHGVQNFEDFARGGTADQFSPDKIADIVDKSYDMRKLYESVLDYKEMAKKFGPDADAMFADKYGSEPSRIVKSNSKASKKEIVGRIEKAKAEFDEYASIFGKDPMDIYHNLAGEAESRAVQDRIGMDMKTRRASFPDYANRNDLIIRGLMEPLGK